MENRRSRSLIPSTLGDSRKAHQVTSVARHPERMRGIWRKISPFGRNDKFSVIAPLASWPINFPRVGLFTISKVKI
jgi:hypothetical protein